MLLSRVDHKASVWLVRGTLNPSQASLVQPGAASTGLASVYGRPDSTQLVHQSTLARRQNSEHNFIAATGRSSILTLQLTHTKPTTEAGSVQVLF